MNMQENNEFPGIGKKTPYKVSDGFFEQISEKTLLKAKQREQNRRKNLILWRTMAVAASMAAVFFLGYIISGPDIKQESNQLVQNNQPVEQQIIGQKQEIAKKPTVAEIRKVEPEKVTEKIIAEMNDTEVIGDVLADLSDEELLQLAAMYKIDPFIGESEQ